MENTVAQSAELLADAWREFQARVPVKPGFIESDRHYGVMIDFMNGLLDGMGDQKAHPVSGLLDVVGFFVQEYEERTYSTPELQRPLAGQTELHAAAAKLYELGWVSQEVAAQIAGVSRSEFLTVLSQHKISPFQETAEEALSGVQLLLQP
jgi:predicted HTH domain antitoxin